MTKKYYCSPERFKTLRLINSFSKQDCADFLHVSISTIKSWESGANNIPYAAYRLLRLNTGQILHDDWEGWYLRDGLLYTPYNRAFKPSELYYLHNSMSMARIWLKERKNAKKVLIDMPIRGIVERNGEIRVVK